MEGRYCIKSCVAKKMFKILHIECFRRSMEIQVTHLSRRGELGF